MRMDPARDNVFSMRDEVSHTKLRAKMAAGVSREIPRHGLFSLLKIANVRTDEEFLRQYSGKENLSMEGTIDTQIAKLVQLIETKYLSTAHDYRPMDLGVKGQYFTLDVISDLAFGHAFGFMDKDDDVFDYLKITKSFIPIMLLLADIPALARLLHSRLMRGLLPKESDKLGFGAFIG